MWETADPDGRAVLLELRGWSHIVRRHPYIGVTQEDILSVVARPDERVPGRAQGEEWFYGRGIGPSEWIRVVVHFDQDRGLIVTAFPRRSLP